MKPSYSEQLRRYVEMVRESHVGILGERKELLSNIAGKIRDGDSENGDGSDLIFICTHNSRRSHFAHVWCTVALAHFEISGLRCGSGGTEVTACNERTIATLKRAGMGVSRVSDGDNPHYRVVFSKDHEPVECFSKIYNQPPNPERGFFALLCCSDVDEKCPVIAGATSRFSLHYQDPKQSDDTDSEERIYDERCMQIATEMFCLAELLSS